VYGKLEEPDGLSGLVQLRQGGATPADHMLAAQKAGAWSEALSLYEQVHDCCCFGFRLSICCRSVLGCKYSWQRAQ
jgi:hypothetical protein